MISQKEIFRLVAKACNFSNACQIIILYITFHVGYIMLELHSFTIQRFVGIIKISLHALNQWLELQLTQQLRNLAALARGTWVASIGRGLLCIFFNSNRNMEAARTIETSVITSHKRQDSTLNIYRRPNPNLQLTHYHRVALSLYSSLHAVVPRCLTMQTTRCRSQ